jgi:hypothetical protein
MIYRPGNSRSIFRKKERKKERKKSKSGPAVIVHLQFNSYNTEVTWQHQRHTSSCNLLWAIITEERKIPPFSIVWNLNCVTAVLTGFKFKSRVIHFTVWSLYFKKCSTDEDLSLLSATGQALPKVLNTIWTFKMSHKLLVPWHIVTSQAQSLATPLWEHSTLNHFTKDVQMRLGNIIQYIIQ